MLENRLNKIISKFRFCISESEKPVLKSAYVLQEEIPDGSPSVPGVDGVMAKMAQMEKTTEEFDPGEEAEEFKKYYRERGLRIDVNEKVIKDRIEKICNTSGTYEQILSSNSENIAELRKINPIFVAPLLKQKISDLKINQEVIKSRRQKLLQLVSEFENIMAPPKKDKLNPLYDSESVHEWFNKIANSGYEAGMFGIEKLHMLLMVYIQKLKEEKDKDELNKIRTNIDVLIDECQARGIKVPEYPGLPEEMPLDIIDLRKLKPLKESFDDVILLEDDSIRYVDVLHVLYDVYKLIGGPSGLLKAYEPLIPDNKIYEFRNIQPDMAGLRDRLRTLIVPSGEHSALSYRPPPTRRTPLKTTPKFVDENPIVEYENIEKIRELIKSGKYGQLLCDTVIWMDKERRVIPQIYKDESSDTKDIEDYISIFIKAFPEQFVNVYFRKSDNKILTWREWSNTPESNRGIIMNQINDELVKKIHGAMRLISTIIESTSSSTHILTAADAERIAREILRVKVNLQEAKIPAAPSPEIPAASSSKIPAAPSSEIPAARLPKIPTETEEKEIVGVKLKIKFGPIAGHGKEVPDPHSGGGGTYDVLAKRLSGIFGTHIRSEILRSGNIGIIIPRIWENKWLETEPEFSRRVQQMLDLLKPLTYEFIPPNIKRKDPLDPTEGRKIHPQGEDLYKPSQLIGRPNLMEIVIHPEHRKPVEPKEKVELSPVTGHVGRSTSKVVGNIFGDLGVSPGTPPRAVDSRLKIKPKSSVSGIMPIHLKTPEEKLKIPDVSKVEPKVPESNKPDSGLIL